jgi:general secretion pathway protein G
MRRMRRDAGFTLIEMLVVVFILALLAGLVGPPLFDHFEGTKKKTAKTQVEGFEQSVRMFQLDTGRLPTTSEGLRVLIPPPPAVIANYQPGGYLDDNAVPLDPWGNEFDYRVDGTQFTVVSYGPDGVQSGDDITNWTAAR